MMVGILYLVICECYGLSWYVVWLQVVWFVYEICGLITLYVSCCAKCHFLPFLPASSITMPRSWKILSVEKTPTNSTLLAYHLILPAYDTKRSHFRHYRTKIRKMADQNRRVKIWYVVRYALHISHFLVINHSLHYSKYYLLIIVNLIYYYLLNYPYHIT